jgi:hypothetical protein
LRYRTSTAPTSSAADRAALHRIEEIAKRLPGFPMVMHGSSTVRRNEVRRINEAGCKLKEGAKGASTKKSISPPPSWA